MAKRRISKGLEEKVNGTRTRQSWMGWKLKDFKEYYKLLYNGMSSHEVRKLDNPFYKAVLNYGYNKKIFPEMRADYDGWTLKDFQEHYQENYKGFSRNEVIKYGGRSFINAAGRRGWTDKVFPKSQNNHKGLHQSYHGWKKKDFQDFYQANFAGMSINEVIQNEGQGFYKAVHRRGWVDSIFTVRKIRSFRGWDLKKCQRHYKQNFAGMTRTEIIIGRGIGKQGGIYKVRELYGVEFHKNPPGYYRDFANVERELQPIIEELGRFPTYNELRDRNTALISGIQKHQGGMAGIRMKMGLLEREAEVIKQLVEDAI